MTSVQTLTVEEDEADLRLDRWFKRRFPHVTHGRLQKWLRTGQIRVDGGRAKAGTRLESGQTVRIPPLGDTVGEKPKRKRPAAAPSKQDMEAIQAWVVHRDKHVIVLNKPPGLAVQGGSGTHRHIDGMLDALRFDAKERPRLVHRLDRDTSGVLLLARSTKAARDMGDSFKSKQTRKLYWGLVVGVPRPSHGIIDMPLAKLPGKRGERMVADEQDGKRAVSVYRVLETAGRKAAWLAIEPITGRTHQIRVHAADGLETPILGDGKYGGQEAFLDGEGIARQVHLHARSVRIPHPAGGFLEISAPMPEHMERTCRTLGLSADAEYDQFSDLEGLGLA